MTNQPEFASFAAGRTVLCLLALLPLAGCTSRQGSMADATVPDGAPLPVRAERLEVLSSYGRPLRVVIYDQASLARLGLVDLPVDFRRDMVLLAAMGPAPSEDCAIRIERVWRDGPRLRVEVTSVYPSEGALRHAGAASPFHAVVVPRCELPIEGFNAKIPPQAVSPKAVRRS